MGDIINPIAELRKSAKAPSLGLKIRTTKVDAFGNEVDEVEEDETPPLVVEEPEWGDANDANQRDAELEELADAAKRHVGDKTWAEWIEATAQRRKPPSNLPPPTPAEPLVLPRRSLRVLQQQGLVARSASVDGSLPGLLPGGRAGSVPPAPRGGGGWQSRDTSDWRVLDRIFEPWRREHGPWGWEMCVDEERLNAHSWEGKLGDFSAQEDCLLQPMAGRGCYGNGPFHIPFLLALFRHQPGGQQGTTRHQLRPGGPGVLLVPPGGPGGFGSLGGFRGGREGI